MPVNKGGIGNVKYPLVADLGIKFHPEQPYSNKRVTLTINDARNFIKETENNPEGTNLWYSNNYYTYGVQKIKNTLNNKVKVNRRVFFISNFEIIK